MVKTLVLLVGEGSLPKKGFAKMNDELTNDTIRLQADLTRL